MSAADVRDVLEISGPGDKPDRDNVRRPPAKKQKTVEKRPDGITRELYALLGEHPPPVSLSLKSGFKERPRWLEKAKPWEQRAFTNQARGDGLVLKHWVAKKSINNTNSTAATTTGESNENITNNNDNPSGTNTDGADTGGDAMQLDEQPELDYHFARFNIKSNLLKYTDLEYSAISGTGDEDWTREETDYLWNLCEEYDLRFYIIHDRYEYTLPTGEPGPARSLEDIKHRFYHLTRSLLAYRTPIHMMSPSEHNYYTLLAFDRIKESSRKKMAETLFNRKPEEVREEEFLLAEMKRILQNQEKLLEERQDLWNRLDAPASQGSIAAYMGSAGLGNLSALVGLSGDKGKKRKSIAAPGGTGAGGASGSSGAGPANIDTAVASAHQSGTSGATPSTAAPTPTTSKPERHEKKGSISNISKDTPSTTPTQSHPPPSASRPLSPQTQAHFGVSYPTEKLASGVYLRSSKVGTIKGSSQPKVQTALNELGIPVKLVMATEKTCKRMETLNQVVSQVLDARRLLEKLEAELKTEKVRLESLG